MHVTETAIPDVLMIEPKVFGDSRGFFFESWNAREFAAAGIDASFVQDNHSRSHRGVLRGLHYQIEHAQGKLVRVIEGEVFDVAVDLRRDSPGFGRWEGHRLDDEKHHQLFVPPGFAHGFCVLSPIAEVEYKCTALYDPTSELGIAWNDPDLAISWPLSGTPKLSTKDAAAPRLKDAPVLPTYAG